MTEQHPQLQQCHLQQPALPEEAPVASESPDLPGQGLESGSGFELWPNFNTGFDDLDFSDCNHDFSDGTFHELHDPDAEPKTLQSQQVLLVQHWEGYNLALERAWIGLEAKHGLKYPWERGIWANIFQDQPVSSGLATLVFHRLPVAPMPCTETDVAPEVKRRKVGDSCASWQQLVLSTDVSSWQETHEAKLDVALKRWYDVVMHFS